MKLWLLSFFLLLPMFDAPTPTDTSHTEAQAETGRQEKITIQKSKPTPVMPLRKKKNDYLFEEMLEVFPAAFLLLGGILWSIFALVLGGGAVVLTGLLTINGLFHLLALLVVIAVFSPMMPAWYESKYKQAVGGCLVIGAIILLGALVGLFYLISHAILLATNIAGLWVLAIVALLLAAAAYFIPRL
jgi:hypothetical protein